MAGQISPGILFEFWYGGCGQLVWRQVFLLIPRSGPKPENITQHGIQDIQELSAATKLWVLSYEY